MLRDADGDGKPESNEVFADGLKQPFGTAFHPPGPEPRYIYIANTDVVVRLPCRDGQTKAEGKPEKLVDQKERARIFGTDPDGRNKRVVAWGVRNLVGLAIHPATGDLWTSVNERDELGDNLVPDYITRVQDGGFYGWP